MVFDRLPTSVWTTILVGTYLVSLSWVVSAKHRVCGIYQYRVFMVSYNRCTAFGQVFWIITKVGCTHVCSWTTWHRLDCYARPLSWLYWNNVANLHFWFFHTKYLEPKMELAKEFSWAKTNIILFCGCTSFCRLKCQGTARMKSKSWVATKMIQLRRLATMVYNCYHVFHT